MERIKQVILVRKDLKMRRGKEIAQGSHASMQFITSQIVASFDSQQNSTQTNQKHSESAAPISLSPIEAQWLTTGMAKVCLRVDSEDQLLYMHQKALDAGLKSFLITDSGRTEFKGNPTHTACAIGPDTISRIDDITGELVPY